MNGFGVVPETEEDFNHSGVRHELHDESVGVWMVGRDGLNPVENSSKGSHKRGVVGMGLDESEVIVSFKVKHEFIEFVLGFSG